MASGSSFEEELKCSLCLNVFVEPSVLQCGHSFCCRCLEELRQQSTGRLHHLQGRFLRQFNCPKCRQPVEIPSRPQVCYELHSLAQAVRRKNDSSSTLEDGESFVVSAGEAGAAGDNPAPVTSHGPRCTEHSNPITCFCDPCQQLLCGDCVLEHHSDHSWCKVSEARAKLAAATRNLVEQCDLKYSRLLEAEEHAQMMREETEARRRRLMRQVRRRTEDFIFALRRRQRELETSIEDRLIDATAAASRVSEQARSCAELVAGLSRDAAEQLRDGEGRQRDDAAVVSGYANWVRRVQSASTNAEKVLEEVPTLTRPQLCVRRSGSDTVRELAVRGLGELEEGDDDGTTDEESEAAPLEGMASRDGDDGTLLHQLGRVLDAEERRTLRESWSADLLPSVRFFDELRPQLPRVETQDLTTHSDSDDLYDEEAYPSLPEGFEIGLGDRTSAQLDEMIERMQQRFGLERNPREASSFIDHLRWPRDHEEQLQVLLGRNDSREALDEEGTAVEAHSSQSRGSEEHSDGSRQGEESEASRQGEESVSAPAGDVHASAPDEDRDVDESSEQSDRQRLSQEHVTSALDAVLGRLQQHGQQEQQEMAVVVVSDSEDGQQVERQT